MQLTCRSGLPVSQTRTCPNNDHQFSPISWADCAVPPAPRASVSPSAKWDDKIPLLFPELSGGSGRTLGQEVLETVEGRGSAKPRDPAAPPPLAGFFPYCHLFQEALWISGKAPF